MRDGARYGARRSGSSGWECGMAPGSVCSARPAARLRAGRRARENVTTACGMVSAGERRARDVGAGRKAATREDENNQHYCTVEPYRLKKRLHAVSSKMIR